jgi:hypothetical protein
MRYQRRRPATATVVHASGAMTETIEGALLEPQSPISASDRAARGSDNAEARDPRRLLVGARPQLVGETVINFPGTYDIGVDDKITINGVTWRATGAGSVWLDRTKVPVIKVTTLG